MTAFTELSIAGIDEDRLPKIRKEAYIDLHFRLSAEPPVEWCEDFNALGRQVNPAAKIDLKVVTTIDTYVNDMNNIPAHLAEIKQLVRECNASYSEKIKQRAIALAASNAALQGQGGAQDELNQIIAALEFDSPS